MSRVSPRRAACVGVAALLALLLLGGCASGLSVRSDVDPEADFGRYTAFDFFEPMGVEGGYNSPIFGELFREAIASEMTARGYRQDPNPDLRINVTIRSDDKVRIKARTDPYMSGAYYQRPGGAYYGSGVGMGVGVSSRATVTTEASIFIDLVDTSTNRMVWQGVAVADVNDKVAQRLRDAVFTSVNRIYQQYPHRASR